MNALRGHSVCVNSLRIRRDVLERELLAGLQAKVWREEFVEYTLMRFEEALQKALSDLDGELRRMRGRKATLDAEIANLTEAIAKTGFQSPSVMEQIVLRENERSKIADQLLDREPRSIRARVDEIRKFCAFRVG